MASESKVQPIISEEVIDKLRESLVSLAKSIGYPSIIAALFYYLGLARVQAIYAYFGINRNLLTFSVQDYLINSIVASFEPIRWLLILGLAGLWFNFWVGRKIAALSKDAGSAEGDAGRDRPHGVRRLVRFILVAGAISLLSGPFLFLTRLASHPFIYPITWTLGVALLTYGAYLGVRLRKALDASGIAKTWFSEVPETVLKTSATLLMVMLVFSAFWFVSYYAQVIGNWEAGYMVSNIESMPCVEIYSHKPLNLQGEAVAAEQVSSEADAYQYHYSGLRFLLYSSEKYFLLPLNWSRQEPRAIIINDNDNVRVEVAPGYYCIP